MELWSSSVLLNLLLLEFLAFVPQGTFGKTLAVCVTYRWCAASIAELRQTASSPPEVSTDISSAANAWRKLGYPR